MYVLKSYSFALVLFITASNANATLLLQPPGLDFGDQYRLVFVTSTTRNAESSAIADYNTFVQTAAANNSSLSLSSFPSLSPS